MQHLLLLSLALLIGGLAGVAFTLPGGLSTTFSQRVAHHKTGEILYSLLFMSALSILYIFLSSWFVPHNNIPRVFLVFAAVAVSFQIACTWVPERGGWMTVVHRCLTGISGLALLPAMWVLATTQGLAAGLRYALWCGLLLMVGLLIIALANQKGFKYALLLQVGYYALFFTALLLVTYR